MTEILNWVKSGLLFGIVGSVFLMLSPNKSYEKYISFIIGLLFLLVMLHPLMEFLSVDSLTLLNSVKNYLSIESNSLTSSENDRKLYENALGIELKAVFTDAGYELKEVNVSINETGEVTAVNLVVNGQMENSYQIENYLHNLFGEEVLISYETW